ncbi:MAG: hypothetical protein JF616_11320 [Fibrobacteres bacterium]|jgi:hypothetical protein|nr:hypothetical protein [Fibrobacterota bacterium]
MPFRLRLRPLFAAAFLISACAAPRTLAPASAGIMAARLANDRCQKLYGARPFAPEDFEAVWERDRWHWGSATAERIEGYDVDVSFNTRGGSPHVEVSLPPE